MSSGASRTHPSPVEDHLAAVDELVRLEDENLAHGLSPEKRQRWEELSTQIFGSGLGHERRESLRIETSHPAHIITSAGEIPAEVTSLSGGGLFLRTDQASGEMVGRELEVAVRFPLVGEQTASFRVQVCWVAPPKKSPAPGLGVRFVDLDRGKRRLLLDLLAHELRARRQMFERQRMLERQLLQADKLATVGRIAASVAHDINNPLAYVLNNMTHLKTSVPLIQQVISRAVEQGIDVGGDPDKVRSLGADLANLIQDTLHGLWRIRDIMDNLREYTRLDPGTETRVDVNQALEASLRIVGNLIQHRARLERDFASSLPQTHLHLDRLSLVFLNLLTNAAQSFREPDTKRNVVRVSTRAAPNDILVTIGENSGVVPDEVGEFLAAGETTDQRPAGGIGLGLAIAQQSAKVLGGSLEVHAGEASGTSVILRLPVIRRKSESFPRLGGAVSTGARRRVLLVDDDLHLLRSLERALQSTFDLTTTTSPARALELLEREKIDVILSDIMIPEMRGGQFTQEVIRRFPHLASKIVLMTAQAFDLSPEEKAALASHPVLLKPLDLPELSALLAGV
jgi:signal transduction histidine kinase